MTIKERRHRKYLQCLRSKHNLPANRMLFMVDVLSVPKKMTDTVCRINESNSTDAVYYLPLLFV